MRARIETWATQWVGKGRGSPYDALSRFSDSVMGAGDGDEGLDLPLRMAQLLAEGTGARWNRGVAAGRRHARARGELAA